MQEFRKAIYRTKQTDTPDYYTYNLSAGKADSDLACKEEVFPTTLYTTSSSIMINTIFYTDTDLTMIFNGLNNWFKYGAFSYRIFTDGKVMEISEGCREVFPVVKYCYLGSYDPDDTVHVPPGGVVDYTDEYGDPKTRDMITTAGIVSIFSSSIPVIIDACYEVTCP